MINIVDLLFEVIDPFTSINSNILLSNLLDLPDFATILNLFPLTIAEDVIVIDDQERKKLIIEIEKMKMEKDKTIKSSYAWTGDTKGHEFLFSNIIFKNLANKISKAVINYLKIFEINTDLLDIYFQRSKPNIFKYNVYHNKIKFNIIQETKYSKIVYV